MDTKQSNALSNSQFKNHWADTHRKDRGVVNMLWGPSPLVIESFRYFEGGNGFIYADKAVFYKELGFFLYKDDHCIFSFKGELETVRYIENFGEQSHYYISPADKNIRSMYLIAQRRDKPVIEVGDLVSLVGDDSYKLHQLFSNHPEDIVDHMDELKQTLLWKVVTKEETALSRISNGKTEKLCWDSDLILFSAICKHHSVEIGTNL